MDKLEGDDISQLQFSQGDGRPRCQSYDLTEQHQLQESKDRSILNDPPVNVCDRTHPSEILLPENQQPPAQAATNEVGQSPDLNSIIPEAKSILLSRPLVRIKTFKQVSSSQPRQGAGFPSLGTTAVSFPIKGSLVSQPPQTNFLINFPSSAAMPREGAVLSQGTVRTMGGTNAGSLIIRSPVEAISMVARIQRNSEQVLAPPSLVSMGLPTQGIIRTMAAPSPIQGAIKTFPAQGSATMLSQPSPLTLPSQGVDSVPKKTSVMSIQNQGSTTVGLEAPSRGTTQFYSPVHQAILQAPSQPRQLQQISFPAQSLGPSMFQVRQETNSVEVLKSTPSLVPTEAKSSQKQAEEQRLQSMLSSDTKDLLRQLQANRRDQVGVNRVKVPTAQWLEGFDKLAEQKSSCCSAQHGYQQ